MEEGRRQYRFREALRFWLCRGSALPAVMLAILVLFFLGSGLLDLALLERRSAANDVKILRATYLAEAGIHLGLAHLRRDPFWREGMGATYIPQVEGRILEVSITPKTLSYRMRSLGEFKNVQRAVEVDLARPLFTYALGVNGDFTLKNPIYVNGDIFATGTVYLQKGAAGNVAAGRDLTIQNNAVVQGSIVTGRYLYNYGIIRGDAAVGQYVDRYGNDPNYYGRIYGQLTKGLDFAFPQWPADLLSPYRAGYPLPAGTYTLAALQSYMDNVSPGEGGIKVLFCDGDLTIRADEQGKNKNGDVDFYTGKAVLAASGDIILGKDIRAATDNDALAFVAGNDILLDGGITVDAAIMTGRYIYKQGAESIINGSLTIGGIGDIEENEGEDNKSMKTNGRGEIKGPLTVNFRDNYIKNLGPVMTAGWQLLSWRVATLN